MPHRDPRYLRIFKRWFEKNQHRFLVPIALKKINASKTKVVFPAHPEVIGVSLWTWNLSVHAICDDQFMDYLLDLDCVALKTYKGYQCKLCEKPRQTWPTLEDLYANDLYEPFLKWVNERLSVATGVAIYDSEGATWAELNGIKSAAPKLEDLKVHVPFTSDSSTRRNHEDLFQQHSSEICRNSGGGVMVGNC